MRTSYFHWSLTICLASCLAANLAAQDGELPGTRSAGGKNDASVEAVEVRDFDVRVDRKLVGTHRLTIKSGEKTQQVAFQSDVKLDFIVYAYVFKSRGTEVWREGQLENADIRCEDGGKKRSLTLKTDGSIQEIACNGKSIPSSSICQMTTAYWRLPPADARSKPLTIVNTDSGSTHSVRLNVLGKTTISIADQTLDCHHVKIDGPSSAELWFDDQDRLVRQKSIEEGHQLELVLKQIRISKKDR